jgi:ABC-type multidrug transport system permease subunit
VPGLICVVLPISTLLVTALSITRERERGTMENLLAMPVRPIEVMLAKIVPYIFVGYIQVVLILTVSALFFQLPVRGSVALLLVALGLFIASNLALGITFSTVAANQMQAIQFAMFTFLPSILLSGFMFPFKGMPVWAQWVGEIIPTTHAMRVVRPAAQGKSPAGNPPRTLADHALRAGGHHDRGLVLPRDARLNVKGL